MSPVRRRSWSWVGIADLPTRLPRGPAGLRESILQDSEALGASRRCADDRGRQHLPVPSTLRLTSTGSSRRARKDQQAIRPGCRVADSPIAGDHHRVRDHRVREGPEARLTQGGRPRRERGTRDFSGRTGRRGITDRRGSTPGPRDRATRSRSRIPKRARPGKTLWAMPSRSAAARAVRALSSQLRAASGRPEPAYAIASRSWSTIVPSRPRMAIACSRFRAASWHRPAR